MNARLTFDPDLPRSVDAQKHSDNKSIKISIYGNSWSLLRRSVTNTRDGTNAKWLQQSMQKSNILIVKTATETFKMT